MTPIRTRTPQETAENNRRLAREAQAAQTNQAPPTPARKPG